MVVWFELVKVVFVVGGVFKDGVMVFNIVCGVCYNIGVVGVLKMDDKVVWVLCIVLGKEVFYKSVIGGKGVMLVKGGVLVLFDDEIKGVVDYVLS